MNALDPAAPSEKKVLVLSPFPPLGGKAAARGAALAHAFDGAGATVSTLDAPGTSFAARHIHFTPKRRYLRESRAILAEPWALVVLAPAALDLSKIRTNGRAKWLAVAARHIGLFMRLGLRGRRVLVVRGGANPHNLWLFWAATLCLLALRPLSLRITRATNPDKLAKRYFGAGPPAGAGGQDAEDTLIRLAGGGLRLGPAWLNRALAKAPDDARTPLGELLAAAQFHSRHAHAPFQTPPLARQSWELPAALNAVMQTEDTPLGAMSLHMRSHCRAEARFDIGTPGGRARLLEWYVEQAPELAQAALPLPAPLLAAFHTALGDRAGQMDLVASIQAHLPTIARRLKGQGPAEQMARDFETLVFLSRFTIDLRACAPALVTRFSTLLPGAPVNRFQLLCAVLGRMPIDDATIIGNTWMRPELADWFEAHVVAQAPALSVFSTRPVPLPAPAIRLISSGSEASGLGENARMSRNALAGLKVSRPVALHHANADALPLHILRHGTGAAFNIGYLLWEVEQLPFNHYLANDCLDAIWAPSKFVAALYENAFERPVTCVGKAIELPAADLHSLALLARARFGLDARHHLVLVAFDAHSSIVRKNPLATLRAFQLAFDGDADARLIIKSTPLPTTHWGDPEAQFEAIRAAAARDPRIIINTSYLPYGELLGLIASADILVSSHRAEGFGYMPAFALALGRPVAATDYSGTRDFVTEATGFPIGWQPRDIQKGETIFPVQAAQWAEIDRNALAATLARHRADPGEGLRRAAQGQKLMQSHYAPAALRERYHKALADLDLLT